MSELQIVHIGNVVVLTLDAPARRNLLSASLCSALSAAVATANADPAVHALVVTGTGSAFCAGADLGDLEAAAAGETESLFAVYKAFIDIADSPLPTIAAVNGAAIGAGMNLALACDTRIATAQARFETRFVQIGLHPGGGHAWMLERAVGWAEASRMLLFGKAVSGEDALRMGLVQSLSLPEALLDDALALAGTVNAMPRELLLRTKASLRLATTVGHAEAIAHETREQLWSLGELAFAERVAALREAMTRK